MTTGDGVNETGESIQAAKRLQYGVPWVYVAALIYMKEVQVRSFSPNCACGSIFALDQLPPQIWPALFW